jgi:hypothetical protein
MRWMLARLAPLMAALIMVMSLYVWNPRSNTAESGHPGYVENLATALIEDQRPALWIGGEDAI